MSKHELRWVRGLTSVGHGSVLIPYWVVLVLCLQWGLWLQHGSVHAATVRWQEEFGTDPAEGGWKSAGASELFQWNRDEGVLEITWDSSQTNSYYYRELPRALTLADDFSASWDLRASRVEAGVNPDKPGTFQMAAGFLNLDDALGGGFVRGSGTGSPNLVEWNYFPDTGFGETFSSAAVSSQGVFQSAMQFPFPMRLGEWHRVELKYEAALRKVSLVVTSASLGRLVVGPLVLQNRFAGFRLDAFAFSSYSDGGQDPEYGGSIFAQARVDHWELTVPGEEVLRISALNKVGDHWRVKVDVQAGGIYRLMRSADLLTWVEVARWHAGESGEVEMGDPDPGVGADLAGKRFYRVETGLP